MEEPVFPPSPVPGDDNLWPGETPFTNFGQFGIDMLDLRVFDQDVWCVDRLGHPHLIDEMPDDYIANVIGHLEENVVSFYYGPLQRSLGQMVGDMLLGRVNADLLASAAGAPGMEELTPTDWLEGTPLMRRLRQLEAPGARSCSQFGHRRIVASAS